jgi:succinate dehydrogenase / fumarate reductase cytochrome b subunit
MIDNRPLSPHIQIYKPQITSITSILHRLTGVALYLGVVLLCILISHYTYQVNIVQKEYKCDCIILKTIIYTVMFLWTFALYYHLSNGIRHLFWDIGKGFEIETVRKTGIAVLVTALTLTLASFAFVFLS